MFLMHEYKYILACTYVCKYEIDQLSPTHPERLKVKEFSSKIGNSDPYDKQLFQTCSNLVLKLTNTATI